MRRDCFDRIIRPESRGVSLVRLSGIVRSGLDLKVFEVCLVEIQDSFLTLPLPLERAGVRTNGRMDGRPFMLCSHILYSSSSPSPAVSLFLLQLAPCKDTCLATHITLVQCCIGHRSLLLTSLPPLKKQSTQQVFPFCLFLTFSFLSLSHACLHYHPLETIHPPPKTFNTP